LLAVFVAVAALVMVLLGVGCWSLLQTGTKVVTGAKVTAEQFLTALENGDEKAARSLLSAQAGSSQAGGNPENAIAVLKKAYGKPKHHTGPTNTNIGSFNGVTKVGLIYSVTFENGQAPVQIVLTPENGQWKIVGFSSQIQ
jgi:hypothetical protein